MCIRDSDNTGDTITENSGEGTDLIQSSVSYTAFDIDVENLTLTGSLNITGKGNNSANVITGNSGNNTLLGYSGTDTLYGNNGNDSLYGANNNDILYGGTGDDSLYGGKHNDTLYGESGNDSLNGGNGDDSLYGGNNDDNLYGGLGNDELTGGSGNDDFQIVTGFGRDLITDYSSGEDSLEISGSYSQNDFTFSYASGHTNIYLGDDLLAIIQNATLTAADLNII